MAFEIEKKGFPYLFRYRPNNDYTIDEIQNSYIYFPNREKLNDPFDAGVSHLFKPIFENSSYSEILKIFEESINKNENQNFNYFTFEYLKYQYPDLNSLKSYINSYLNSIINERGIACFTTVPVHILLWAIYANNHQGICIQYNMDLDMPFFKNYSQVKYTSKFEKIDFEKEIVQNSFHYLFHTKLSIWSKEYEVRLVKEKSGRHNLNSSSMRSISFGLRTSEEYKTKVIEIVKEFHPHIELYNSSIMPDGPGLTFERIEFM